MKARELSPDDLEVGEVEILRLGDHEGAEVDLTAEDLDAIVADYDPAKRHQATAVIDHDWTHDREPHDVRRAGINHGLVESLRRVKDSVVAKIANVTDELKTLVNAKRLNALSPELYPAFRGTNRKHLRCVAFQGAEPPAQKGLLAPILFSEGDEKFLAVPIDHPTIRLGESTKGPGTMTDEERKAAEAKAAAEKKIADDKAAADKAAEEKAAADKKIADDKTAEDLRKAALVGDPSLLEKLGGIVKAAVDAAVAPLQTELASVKSKLSDLDPQSGEGAILAFAERLVNEGRIEGKDKDRVIARCRVLRGQTIKFGENQSISALQDYMDSELARTPVVPTGELPRSGPGIVKFGEKDKKPEFELLIPENSTPEQIDRLKRLGAFAAERGIKTFGEASVKFEEHEREAATR